jgi:hypothetical protein
MSDFKVNSNSAIPINPQNDLSKDTTIRSGNFRGANVNAVSPPDESPFANAPQQQLGANRSQAPAPSDEELANFAFGDQNDKVANYLATDAAASKAVADIQRGIKAIGSPDREPKLDAATEQRLKDLSVKLFRS